MERRLVAILVANVVGYRRAIELIEALGLPHRGEAVGCETADGARSRRPFRQ